MANLILPKLTASDTPSTINSNIEKQTCSRISESLDAVPEFLKEMFENNSSNLDFSQKQKFTQLLIEFHDIFQDDDIAGRCTLVEHEIKLVDLQPIKQPVRHLPFHVQAEINKMIREMQNQGVIEESSSSWCSPVVLKKKKDGTWRFCVDFRKLNSKTIKDSYPLPRIDRTLDKLSGKSWFSTLDLKSGYWQIKIRPEDREKTAFSIGNGLWQFIVMAFGLCNAPATFERLMEKLLRDLLDEICLIYLDDVMVMAKSFDEMLQNLKIVFLRIREAGLKLNRKKCNFFQREVEYLGHIVSEDGIKTDPKKIETIVNWPVPSNKKQVKSFVGLCSYYRRFITGFSSIAKPLYRLTDKITKFDWNNDCQQAFSKLKEALSTPPILAFPHFDTPFILDTDASGHGIGAVLSQVHDGVEKVIGYYSRVLNKAEQNYCVTRRELLAVIESVKNFHYYLCGKPFFIRTDHSSLTWLLSFKDLDGQLARWIGKLDQYDFKILHRKGSSHNNADSLSRRPCNESSCKYCSNVEQKYSVGRIIFEQMLESDWKNRQFKDDSIRIILDFKKNNNKPSLQDISSTDESTKIYLSQWDSLIVVEGILYRKWISSDLKSENLQLIVPKSCINRYFVFTHRKI